MSGRRVRPPGGFELWWWYFMRVSGLVLVVLALGHLTIMHILNNVEVINYAFVSSRWADPKTGVLWRLWDLMLINLAVLHGFNGVRQVLYEYILSPSRRVLTATLIWSTAVVLIVLGTYAIMRFEKDTDYLRRFQMANPGLDVPVTTGDDGVAAPPAVASRRPQ